MRNLYTKSTDWGIMRYILVFIAFSFSINSIAQSLAEENEVKDCANCFSSELISMDRSDDCISVELQVNAESGCLSALSHFTVEVPDGATISNVYNSKGWKIENPTKDPTSSLNGFKIDDISNFGENGESGTFSVEYTVCANNQILDSIENKILVAYKAGTCVFYQEIENTDTLEYNLSASIEKKDISCFGGNNGEAEAIVTEGKAPFSYLWSNGSTNAKISGLKTGEYQVTVTDSTGNSLALSATIQQPETDITIVSDAGSTTCAHNSGSIQIAVTGGTGSYTYLWNNGKTTKDLDQLYAGTYILQVLDSVGCSKKETVQISEDTDLSVSLTPNYLQCHEEDKGEVTSSVTGGLPPYTYSWSNGDTTSTISGVHSGSYTLTVMDANGCTATASTYVGISTLSISTSVINPTCNGGNDGAISVINIRYGSEPYQYSWDTGDTTAVISDIVSGRYKVTVTDANGCSVSRSVNLADRAALSLNYSIDARDCSTDSEATINISGSGGVPSYEYFSGDTAITSPLVVDGSGNYDITMKDALGCEYTKTISVTNSTETINVSANVSQPACGGSLSGAAEIIATGGSEPYQYYWNDGSFSKTRNNLDPGGYQVEVTDNNGCFSSTDFTVEEAATVTNSINASGIEVQCSSGGNILTASSSGATTYTWEIIDNDNSWYIEESSLDTIMYYAGNETAKFIYSVMNDEGCLATDTLSISCNTDSQNNGSGDNSNGDGSDDGGSIDNGDDVVVDTDNCISGCMYSNISAITPLDGEGCYHFVMNVYTDGTCDHELSHFNVGLKYGTIGAIENSNGWKIEKNSTDPKTGLYGFKIDEITGFGQSGPDQFKIEFDVCFNNTSAPNYLPDSIPVVFKASTCYALSYVDILQQEVMKDGLTVSAQPNPFIDQAQITVASKNNTDVEICIYDIYGKKIETLYSGIIKSDIKYTFKYDGKNDIERLYIYKIISKNGVIQGKLLRVN